MTHQLQIFNIFGSDTRIDIHRSLKLKSISIKIRKDYIKVTVPFFLNNKKIDELLKKKINWIKKQLHIHSIIHPSIKKTYLNGEEFKYLGHVYKLQILQGIKYSVKIKDDLLIVGVKNIDNKVKIKKIINNWFRYQSDSYFKENTFNYAKKINLKITSVKVREYKARWGSCSINGDISFNWRLIMAPPDIIRYVIIHELMHIKEHNHSSRYWEHVRSLYPNIKEAKEWLMYNGQSLNI